jgi:hypothetical protein
LTEDQFRRGPAENRLRRVVDEIKAIVAEVAAVPYLAPARRDPLRLATLDLLGGLTEVDLFVVADGRVLVLGSRPDAAAIAAAASLVPARLPFGGHPPVPEPKPRRPRR